MKMNQIEYFEDTKQLFRKFVKPVTIDDVDKRSQWYGYEDKIKEFLEEQLKIKINIYFTNNYKGRVWYYIIESSDWFKPSDEIEDIDILSYNSALNRAIKYIFTKIYDIDLN